MGRALVFTWCRECPFFILVSLEEREVGEGSEGGEFQAEGTVKA